MGARNKAQILQIGNAALALVTCALDACLLLGQPQQYGCGHFAPDFARTYSNWTA